ncbi:tail fiber/spike domain-containing protein, partial [Klebsiella michiganensis]
MPATPQDRLYGLTTSVAVKPPVYISADYEITRFGEQTITSKTPTDERTITTTEGMRVLLLGQDNPVENGIWVARRSFWVRATDFNGPRDAVNGTLVFSINGDCWQVEADDPVVIGKSAIHFRPTYPFEANLDILQRTLRVPEASVNVLPSAGERAWKGLGFDGAGQPKLQDPAGTGLWGYVPAIGSFEKGSLLTQRFEVLLWESTDEYWRWDGAMPKIVLPGSTPDTAGGRGKGKWLDVTDATLRSNLGSSEEGLGGSLVMLPQEISVSDALKGVVVVSGADGTGVIDA